MKLIQALNERKLIIKKISDKNIELDRLSSASSVTLKADTKEKQQEMVDSLLQSVEDLNQRYIELSIRIARTNLETKVRLNSEYLGDREFNLAELLLFKDGKQSGGGLNRISSTLTRLNDNQGLKELHDVRVSNPENPPTLVRFYSVEEKNKTLSDIQDAHMLIASTIETVNATTELL